MTTDAPIIADMRAMLDDANRSFIMVSTSGPFPNIGIRPELLSDNGTNRVWSVTRAQAAKVVAAWDQAAAANREDPTP